MNLQRGNPVWPPGTANWKRGKEKTRENMQVRKKSPERTEGCEKVERKGIVGGKRTKRLPSTGKKKQRSKGGTWMKTAEQGEYL